MRRAPPLSFLTVPELNLCDLYSDGMVHRVNVDPAMPLLWVLWDAVSLRGTKFSCGVGACGACTVHPDGQAVRKWITAVQDAAAKAIVTIEGLRGDGEYLVQPGRGRLTIRAYA